MGEGMKGTKTLGTYICFWRLALHGWEGYTLANPDYSPLKLLEKDEAIRNFVSWAHIYAGEDLI